MGNPLIHKIFFRGGQRPAVRSLLVVQSRSHSVQRAQRSDALCSDWTCNLSRSLIRNISRSKDDACEKEGLGINIYSLSLLSAFRFAQVNEFHEDRNMDNDFTFDNSFIWHFTLTRSIKDAVLICYLNDISFLSNFLDILRLSNIPVF